ncbi:protein of unknown function [Cyanobium sp. NIES-981]|nr:protein of unknown function [Cyanobium sp. NIES-981]
MGSSSPRAVHYLQQPSHQQLQIQGKCMIMKVSVDRGGARVETSHWLTKARMPGPAN